MPHDSTLSSRDRGLATADMFVIGAVILILLGLGAIIGIVLWVTSHRPPATPLEKPRISSHLVLDEPLNKGSRAA